MQTPAFMPVGTRATVTGLEAHTLVPMGADIILGNTYHLLLRPGPEAFRRVGGIHPFMKWTGSVLTDSGGFQIFSLPKHRKITEEGARFRSYIDGSYHMLSPERSIEVQTAIGSDIMMVLDVCVDSRSSEPEMRDAMERTHRWATRSLAARTDPTQALFAIVQGGVDPTLRRESAGFLTELPFDGFALGGLAVGDTRAQREDTTELAAELLPPDRPRYLMGVGTPSDLLRAILMGIDMFDCVLPTNMAWQGTAFTSTGKVRLSRGEYREADTPLDRECSCETCTSYTRAYLHHLYKCGEPLAPYLVSRHNLHYYLALMSTARGEIERGTYASFAKQKVYEIDRHEHAPRTDELSA